MIAKLLSKVTPILEKIKNWSVKKFILLDQQPLMQLVVFSLLINLILEMLSKRSLFGGLIAMVENPIMFVFNILIILFTLVFSTYFKRRYFVILFLSIFWITLGISNYVLLGFRTTPLTGTDFNLLKSVLGIISVYLNSFQIILIAIIALVVLLAIVFAFINLPKRNVSFKNAFYALCCTIILLLGVSNLATKTHAVTTDFGNIAQAFQDYGFSYSFVTSILDRGINKPNTYSPEVVEVVLKEITEDDSDSETTNYSDVVDKPQIEPPMTDGVKLPTDELTELKPNVVMIQLESFFDVNHLIGYEFSDNPVPTFSELKNNFSSGYLTVPSIGSGTANTEFEVLSGMNLDFFGAGEYPFKTVLKDMPMESIAFNLDNLGYKSHAIHNNTATFYGRNKVYPNLGFDSFSSIEYMNGVEYNPLGWAKDEVLTVEIMKALKATEEPDFVFTVSVQPHGKYPDVVLDEEQPISMSGELEETDLIGYEYFLSQLYETDAFINELIQQLNNYKEPTVVVFYGDHLPSMGIQNEDLDNANIFQTEYILWSNFPLENVKKDVSAYQLNAYIMERIGFDEGILTKFHQKNSERDDYQDELLILQYDMLYGDQNVYKGEIPFQTKEMTMGTGPVIIYNIIQRGETLFIYGKNFTKWSEVFIDGEHVDTLLVDINTIIIPMDSIGEFEELYVAQTTEKLKILSTSAPWLLPKDETKEE